MGPTNVDHCHGSDACCRRRTAPIGISTVPSPALRQHPCLCCLRRFDDHRDRMGGPALTGPDDIRRGRRSHRRRVQPRPRSGHRDRRLALLLDQHPPGPLSGLHAVGIGGSRWSSCSHRPRCTPSQGPAVGGDHLRIRPSCAAIHLPTSCLQRRLHPEHSLSPGQRRSVRPE